MKTTLKNIKILIREMVIDADKRFAKRTAINSYGKDAASLFKALSVLFHDNDRVMVVQENDRTDDVFSDENVGESRIQCQVVVKDDGTALIDRGFPEVVANDFNDVVQLVNDDNYFYQRWEKVMYPEPRENTRNYKVWMTDDPNDNDDQSMRNMQSFHDMTVEELEEDLAEFEERGIRILRIVPPLLKRV